MKTLINQYVSPNAFNNVAVLANVAASVGNVIMVAVSGRRNTAIFDFPAPTWNGETLELKSGVVAEPIGMQIYALKCASAATASITLEAGDYGSINAIALVYSGTFGATFMDGFQHDLWPGTVAPHEPTCEVTGVAADDLVLNFMDALLWDGGSNNTDGSTAHTTNGTAIALAEDTDGLACRMYASSNTGTGDVTASYETVGTDVQFRMTAFRFFEEGEDTTPSGFTFTDVTGAALSTQYTSNAITVAGINTASAISITGGTYSINGGGYTGTSGTVVNGDTVSVRVTSSGSYSTAVDVVLTIGGVSDTYTVTTAAEDGTPDSFTFTAYWPPVMLIGLAASMPATVIVFDSINVDIATPV